MTADNETRAQGQRNPPLAFTYAGLENGDTPSVFVGALTTLASSASPAGTYAIRQGTLSAGPNYFIDYIPADLTVTTDQAITHAARPAASLPAINSTLSQANNYIDPTLIMDREINLFSVIYLGNAVPIPIATAVPSAGGAWREGNAVYDLPRHFAITSSAFVTCDGADDDGTQDLCGGASAAAAAPGSTR